MNVSRAKGRKRQMSKFFDGYGFWMVKDYSTHKIKDETE